MKLKKEWDAEPKENAHEGKEKVIICEKQIIIKKYKGVIL